MKLMERYRALDEGQRKLVLFVGVLLAAIGFLMFPSRTSQPPRPVRIPRRLPPSPATRPTNAATAPQPVTPMLSASPDSPDAPDLSLAVRVGNWQGTSMIINRGTCFLSLELHQDNPAVNQFQGFTTLRCIAPWQLEVGKSKEQILKEVYRANSPASAVLTGSIVGTAIQLHADKVIDAADDGCMMKSFSISAFGKGKVATSWVDTPCPGGQMVLERVTR